MRKDVSAGFTLNFRNIWKDFKMWGQVLSLNILRHNKKKRKKKINDNINMCECCSQTILIWLSYASMQEICIKY
jgi:hypothetical protein